MIEDQHLIKRLLDPEKREEGFRELMSLYKERLYWHIRKIVISHDDADDVLQNTFIKVYRNIGSFKGNSKLFSWMYRIATNESITHLNKKAKFKQITSEEVKQLAIDKLESDVYFEGDAIQIKLQKAINTLPEKQQIVFNMKYFDNMKYKDISQVLETSEGALKASYHHAVKKIEDYITSH